MDEHLQEIIHCFGIPGSLTSLVPLKFGHINETYVTSWLQGAQEVRFVHQRINHQVFKDVPRLMENVVRVTAHLRQKRADPRATLQIVSTSTGASFVQDREGHFWRTYTFIEGSQSAQTCSSPEHAFEAARISGQFIADLSDLDPALLHYTIPQFISTPYRYEQLDEAVRRDVMHRAKSVSEEVSFALERRQGSDILMRGLAQGSLPLRVTHNDLKFNNVLFDSSSGKAVCVVDLDTCMPGTPVFDFGDLCRSASVVAAEDETDLKRVSMDEGIFEGLVRGYLEGSAGILKPAERDLLWYAPRLIALTLGVRFLTDHIQGDSYFRIHHPGHNLERARAQFQIVRDMEGKEQMMRAVVGRFAR